MSNDSAIWLVGTERQNLVETLPNYFTPKQDANLVDSQWKPIMNEDTQGKYIDKFFKVIFFWHINAEYYIPAHTTLILNPFTIPAY